MKRGSCIIFLMFAMISPAFAQETLLPQIIEIHKKETQKLEQFYVAYNVQFAWSKEVAPLIQKTMGDKIRVATEVNPQKHRMILAVMGEKFIQQDFSFNTNRSLGPAEIFDGKTTHSVTGIAIKDQKVIGKTKNLRDTIVQGNTGCLPDPIQTVYKVNGIPISEVLEQGKFSIKEENERFVQVMGVYKNGDAMKQTKNYSIRIRFDKNSNFLPVKIESDDGVHICHVLVDQISRTQGVFIPKEVKTDSFQRHNSRITKGSTSRLTSTFCDIKPQDALFEQIAALNIGVVYDQDKRQLYNMKAPIQGFEAERSLSFRRLMGWLFLAGVSTLILLGIAFLVRWRNTFKLS